ncbi:MAG: plastocyanin/azurin family copper-binding protein [Aurantimonas coralicida]|uniref:Plastocyanin/azurin family copper-binding protein n=1 Tax=Jiella pelagia TaxID=2986949 RepID=A0ABY7BXY5_9HYPH|nr:MULTISPECIES: plastocyanin/azurin family copper-binding protein [Aurantimonadaceae]MCC4299059.1 cupredoxin domain-containing protein [Aurantimonas coralicida]WAP68394.1 plastocyanin/azurin family copper-binding protein [Jiella pelagia]
MQNRLMIGAAFVATLLAAPAYAAGSHAGGHDDEMALGKAGEASQVTRTVEVSMVETDDGRMVFEPKTIDVKEGETVRFTFQNKGELPHEFVMDTSGSIQEHKEVMERFPEMEHADPNSISLQPGETGEILWTFTNTGDFEFACLIPGHYESGMHGPLTVATK